MATNWWKEGTVYQIYPASFQDSNGDGIGDIPGIISRLDYLKSIGVNIIWLSPHYKSPQVDMGYDISDYKDIHEPYGTLADCDSLIEECHNRGMKVIFDLVVNHCSDQHQWFKESRSSKTNPKRDWFIWRPARYDENGNRQPPTNWSSYFSGSSWTWDEYTQEYYLHLFASEQPDLNWRNPETRKAIYQDAIKFWLDKGVDGFRVDTVNLYSKPENFEDAPITTPSAKYQSALSIFCNGPHIHEYLLEVNDILSKYDVFTVGELQFTKDPKRVLDYVGESRKQLSMLFQFDVLDVDAGPSQFERYFPKDYKLLDVKNATERWQTFIDGTDGWTTTFLENHDRPRAISHFCDDSPEYRTASGKMLFTWMLTCSGTAFVYQGQEIGMVNVPKSWPIEEYVDIDSTNFYNDHKNSSNGDPKVLDKALSSLQHLARDNCRTPFQWDASDNAGFVQGGSGKPWMRVNDNYSTINAEEEEKNPFSILHYFRSIVKFRNEHKDLMVYGYFRLLDRENPNIFTYAKVDQSNPENKAVVVLNFTKNEQPLPEIDEVRSLKLAKSTLDKLPASDSNEVEKLKGEDDDDAPIAEIVDPVIKFVQTTLFKSVKLYAVANVLKDPRLEAWGFESQWTPRAHEVVDSDSEDEFANSGTDDSEEEDSENSEEEAEEWTGFG